MRLKRTSAAIAATLACTIGTTAMANDELAQIRQEMAQLKAANAQLQSQVGQLQGVKTQTWLNERRAEEVKSLVREVLSDADTRASMQETGLSAGYNKGFFLASEDGKFLLEVGGQVQFRYIMNFRDDSGADDAEGGFQLRRTKLKFGGHIGDPKFKYGLTLATSRNTGDVYLEEAKLTYALADGLSLSFGRFKAPYMREELMSSSKQLAVERSFFNEVFTAGFVEGVGIYWDATDSIKIGAMLHDGIGSGEAGAMDFANDGTDVAGTARIDIKLAGDWKQAGDFNAWSGQDFAAFVGAGIYYDMSESGATTNYRYDLGYTADVLVKNAGWAFMGAISGYQFDGDDGAADTDALGAMAQVGYMLVPDKFEPFARFEYMTFDGSDETKLATAGFNWYLKKHDAKFTADVVWALDPIGGSSGLGLLGDAGNNDDQVAIRAQFQLLF